MKKTLLCFLFLLFTTLFYAQVTNVSMCGSESLDLSSINSDFIRNYPAGTTVNYFLSDNDAANNTNPIADPAHYKYSGTEGTVKIYGRIDDHGIITTNYFNLTVFQYVTVTASHKPILCKGETTALTLGVIGDAANYRYSINGSPFTTNNYYTNLTAGVYNIEVQNTNPICGNSKLTYTIPEPTAVLATVMIENENAIITAFGGVAPYQYSRDGIIYQNNNVFPNLTPGSYPINVRDSQGCGTTVMATILPALIVVATVTQELNCIGNNTGTITAYGTGGQLPYTYSLNGGPFQPINVFNNLSAGTYSINLKDALNNVSPLTAAATIAAPASVNGNLLVTHPTNCTNGSIMVMPTSGQAPYLFSMDDGLTFTTNYSYNNLSPGSYRFLIKDSKGCISTSLPVTLETPLPIIVSANNTAILCQGEKTSLTINATGGYEPYQYSIDNGINYVSNNIFNSLKAGTYNIKVKDNYGCLSEIQHVITEPEILEGDILIEGQTITVINVTGGTGSYEYALNNGTFQTSNVFTNVGAGYSVVKIRDANNCEPISYSVTIASPIPITATVAITKELDCNSNAVIAVTASGGKAPYIYSLDGGITTQGSNIFSNLSAGTYSITVLDNVFSVSQTYPIVINPIVPVLSVVTINKPIDCTSNAIATVTATGGKAPYLYSVDGGTFASTNVFSDLTAGIHTLYTKDSNNCFDALSSIIIDPLANLSATITNTPINECVGNLTSTITVNAIGGQAPFQYSLNGGVYQSTPIFTNVNPGTYIVQVRDAANCLYSQTISVMPASSLTAAVNITKPASCYANDAAITIEAMGGTAPYTYSIGNGYQASNIYTNLSSGSYNVTVKDSKGCLTLIYATIAAPIPLTGTLTKTDASCFGSATGSITMNISNGTAPYSYSLNGSAFVSSNVFSNLTIGDYNVTAKDAAGCTVSYIISISQPNILETTAAILPIYHLTGGTTYGGKITLTSSGGVSPYTYTIRNNATSSILAENDPKTVYNFVQEGSYTIITKDAFGCQIENNNITMVLTSPIVVNAESTAISCSTNNSVITVNATGGTPPYLYSSDQFTFTSTNTFTVTEPGTYSVGVQDAFGIIQYIDHAVKSNIPIVITAAITNVTCFGASDGSIAVTATGGTAPYTYSIGNGYTTTNVFTDLSPKTYTISVKDASGCVNNYSAVITQPELLLINTLVTNNTTVDSNNGSITVTGSGGTAPYQYALKSDSSGLTLVDYQNYNVFTALPVGAYNVQIIDAKGCIAVQRIVVTSEVIFGTLIIKQGTCTALGTITINAAGGKYPHQYSFDGGITYGTSNIASNVAAGIYTIKVKDAGGDILTLSANITAVNPIVATASLTSPILCNGSNDAVIQVTASGGKTPYSYAINGGAFQSSNSFAGLKAGNYLINIKDSNECSRTLVLAVTEPNILLSTVAVINSTITVNATGGTAPYTYTLQNSNGVTILSSQTSNVFNNVPTGIYNVKVSDSKNCIFMQTGINVTAPSPLSALFTITPATCNNGGTITIIATGGTAPYRYSIDNGITYTTSNVFPALTPKNYVILVKDAANVTTSTVAVINQVSAPVITAQIVNIIRCYGDSSGAIRVMAMGGQAPYLYSINGSPFQSNDTFSNLNAGTYNTTVKDANGCMSIVTNTISQPASPLTAIINVENQTATINAQGGTGIIMFAISPGLNEFSNNNTFSDLVPGVYQIMARDENGCIVMFYISIDPPAPIVEGESENAIVYEFKLGQTLAAITVEGENIKWYSSQSTSTSKTLETALPLSTVLVNGTTYYASQTVNGIESKNRLAVTAKLNGSLSTPDFALSGFKFYPNPVKNILTVNHTSVIDEVQIFTVSGESVLFKKINNTHSEIDLSHLSTGVYILNVKSDGKEKSMKIIKE